MKSYIISSNIYLIALNLSPFTKKYKGVNMSIETKKTGNGKVIVIPYNDLVNREASDEIQETIESIIKSGERQLVLNLNNIEEINSYGMGKILMYFKKLKKMGGELYIVYPLPPKIEIVFEAMWLTKIFKGYKVE